MGRGEGDDADGVYMYGELWKACAGPLIYFPKVDDLVYYFPQGHLEQYYEASTDQESYQQQPHLPSKILCRVIDIQLQGEQDTDDVYAHITLLRELESFEITSTDSYHDELLGDSIRSFYKVLTASDVGRHALYVSKSHAEKCFPSLDMSSETPEQCLVAKDIHGKTWKFQHTYRGKYPRHMLTKGWKSFVESKKLVVDDTFVLLRGDDGELRIGVSRLACPDNSFVSSKTAFHVPPVGDQFSVTYKPRLGEFIIPLNKCLESPNEKFSVGMRIKMFFRGKYSEEKRFFGAILGIGDICHSKWPDSEWRCLKIRWDETLSIGSRPEHVSPWEIELLDESILKISSSQTGETSSLGKRKLHVNPDEQVNSYQTHLENTITNHDLIANNSGQLQPWNIHNLDFHHSLLDNPHSFSSLATNLNQGNDQDLFELWGETSNSLQPLLENTGHMPFEETQVPTALHYISSNMSYISAIPNVIPSHGLESGDELVSWGSYLVARRSIAVLDKIKTQYPEMLSSFKVMSSKIQSAMLETLAEVVHRVETLTIESVNQDQLDDFQKDINDLRVSGIEVDWIEERLQAIFRRNVLVQRHKELSQEIHMTSAKRKELKEKLQYVNKELEEINSKIGVDTLTAYESAIQG